MDKKSLERLRQFALYYTMTMALLLFGNWALTGFKETDEGWHATMQLVLLWALCAGGLTMGILYLIYLKTRKK